MKRRILSGIISLTLICSVLMGCGASGSGSASEQSETQVSADTVSEETASEDETVTSYGTYTEADPYELTFAFVELYPQDPGARDEVQNALNEYMRSKYHMEINFLPLDFGSYQQTLQLMISGGDKLDVIPVYFSGASGLIAMNGIVDMAPYMETAEGKAIEDAIGKANAHVGTMGGVLYGFPAQKESVELGGLIMRADICDELGFTEKYNLGGDIFDGTIYDWSVAEDMFRQVKEAYPDMIPLYCMGTQAPVRRFAFFDELVDGFGALDLEADRDSVTVVNMFETETYRETVTRLARWYDEGFLYKDAATDSQGTSTMMKAGNTFSYLNSIKPGVLTEVNAQNGMPCYAMFFGNHVWGGYATTNVSLFNTGIASNSDDPDMAFKFISALYTDPAVMNFWQYGIEGVNYQVLDDGTAYFTEEENDAAYRYHQNTGWELGNQFISYVWNDGTKTKDYWQQLADFNEWAYYSPAYGFLWDPSDYQTEITALSNVTDTYRAALETGSIGGEANVDSALDQMNKALYAAGLQTVLDAKQAQLDAWIAQNGGASQTPDENLELINSVPQETKTN